MKKIILKEISLVNFRGVKEKRIEFGEKETAILGKNATGKSTIFDAFIWLLFGKDQFDRKDFEIIPIENGARLDRVDAEVSAVIEIDGQEMKLKRVLHQKWVRRRGTSEEVFDGCETLFYINDVPLRAGDYKTKIDEIIDETVFKMITNPSFFLSLNWKEQREQLFRIAGTVSDEQIAATNKDFKDLLEEISGKSMQEFKKEISARKRKLNDDLKLIPAKIDQTVRLMPEKKDYSLIGQELKECDEKIKEVENKIHDKKALMDSYYKEIEAIQREINSIKQKQNQIVFEAERKDQQEKFKVEKQKTEIENKIRAAQIQLNNEISHKKQLEKNIESLTAELKIQKNSIDELREKWIQENKKDFDEISENLVCPLFEIVCNDIVANEKFRKNREEARISFYEEKKKKLDRITEEANKKSSRIAEIEKDVAECRKEIEESVKTISEIQKDIDDLTIAFKGIIIPVKRTIIPQQIHEWVELQDEIERLNNSMPKFEEIDVTEFAEEKKSLTAKRDLLLKELSEHDLIERYSNEIALLEEEARMISQQIADIEKKEFTIDAFTKIKIDECENRINKLFEIVKFKLFDKTIDGNEFEVCIATNKQGVPISVTNLGEQVNAGMDIINTLSRFYNVAAPIFIDRRESVNSIVNTGSQIINLIVSEDSELVVKKIA